MDKLKELREKLEGLIESMRAMLDKADQETRDLTDEETAQYAALEADSDKTQRDIERLEKLAEREAQSQAHADKAYVPNFRRKTAPAKEFRNIGEFLYAVACNRNDPRLQDCEYREQSMSAGNEGGFAVPEQFRPELLQVSPQDAIFRPRCQVIPAGDPPDAKLTMPALDQTADENVYGGVVVAKVAEGGAKGETDIRLKEVSLEPGEVAAYITVTDKLLRNWAAASNLLAGQLRKAIIGWEDTQILTGNGIGGPLGIIKAPCRVNVSRGTANTIVVADIQNMYSRAKFGGPLFWVGSQTILPQLLGMVDGASGRIFAPAVSADVPATLFGLPLFYADRSPALGSVGDLCLVDCSYYLIKDGSGPFVATDLGIGNFTTNTTRIKIFWNVDGKPWLSAPLPLEGATTNTVSPFVVLN
jgi:HK97 family phage major capsid protein